MLHLITRFDVNLQFTSSMLCNFCNEPISMHAIHSRRIRRSWRNWIRNRLQWNSREWNSNWMQNTTWMMRHECINFALLNFRIRSQSQCTRETISADFRDILLILFISWYNFYLPHSTTLEWDSARSVKSVRVFKRFLRKYFVFCFNFSRVVVFSAEWKRCR